jgi:hypothetical protein
MLGHIVVPGGDGNGLVRRQSRGLAVSSSAALALLFRGIAINIYMLYGRCVTCAREIRWQTSGNLCAVTRGSLSLTTWRRRRIAV